MKSDIKFAMNDVAAYLVIRLAKENHISREQALEQVMDTTVYTALMDPETGMYCEPKAAVYDMLEAEKEHHLDKMLNVQ